MVPWSRIPVALALMIAYAVSASAGGNCESNDGTDGSPNFNIVDYAVDLRDDQCSRTRVMQTMVCSHYLKQSWLQAMNAEPPSTRQQYIDLLSRVKYEDLNENDRSEDEIPLAFNIDPSLQGIAPFLCSYGLPVGDGFGDSRNLLYVRDGQIRFAPSEPEFIQAIRDLRELYEAGLVDTDSLYGTPDSVNSDLTFSITNPWIKSGNESEYFLRANYAVGWQSWFLNEQIPALQYDPNNTDSTTIPSLVVAEGWSKDWTRAPEFNTASNTVTENQLKKYSDLVSGRKWTNSWRLTEQEEILIPYIDDLVVKNVVKWLTVGGVDQDWSQFQRDMEDLGLPYLTKTWQGNVDGF